MTPEELMEAAKKYGVANVLIDLGEVPCVRLPMSQKFLEQSIQELDLPVRAWNGLMRQGIVSVGKLVERLRQKEGISQVSQIGKKTVAAIKLQLTQAAYDELSIPERLEFWEYTLTHHYVNGKTEEDKPDG